MCRNVTRPFLKWNKLNCIPYRYTDVRPGPTPAQIQVTSEDRYKMENPP